MSTAQSDLAPTGLDPKFHRPRPVPPTPSSWFERPDVSTAELVEHVTRLVKTDFRNVLTEGDRPPIWDPPIIGIAAAHDPVFRRLQEPEAVGPMHRLPEEWLPGAQSVISVFLPFSDPILRSYRVDSPFSSFEFASGRWNGAKFLNVIRRSLIRFCDQHGGRCIAPNIDPRYGTEGVFPYWSERHVAFVAGIGTFGLHQGLITEKGVYGRICSAVTTLKLTPTKRPYRDVYEYCLYATTGGCRACVKRCPTQAITSAGKVPGRCGLNGNGEHFKAWGYWGCGHCSTFVPCERGIPKAIA
jgi:epoxyqueuosine reductase QueG